MIIKRCALCGKNQSLFILYKSTLPKNIDSKKFSARKTPDKIHYQLNLCQNCGLIFSSPIFPPEKINNLYKKSSYSYSSHLPFLLKTYINLFKNVRKSLGVNHPKVLDIGSSNGFFLEGLYNMGIKDIYGVEPSREEVQNASPKIRKKIKVDFFKNNQFPNNFFDIVTCFHTLDHVVNPNNFIRNIRKILKSKGMVILVVHDTQGLSVRLFKEKSPIFDIQHIYLFNKENLKRIFEKNKFKVLEVNSLRNEFSLEYWVLMCPFPKIIKNFASFCLNLFLLKKYSLSLKAGNLFLIARKVS